ncbi:MAG: transporter substrate-binding domain-containing protein [Burkholderiaceae bacterium]|nr:transporter substrate-binding domain-containing protein [Roseateles sp.]MBV8470976.1 transporter substrate-binding domain-containing protein [Burkholderiaceae bacterium]
MALLAINALLAPSLAFAAQQIHLTTFDNDRPISVVCEAILKVAYQRIGLELVIDQMPGERAILSASRGESDGALYRIAGFEKNYPDLIPVPVPLYHVEFVVFSKRLQFPVKDWSSLANYTIGYRRGYKVVELNTRQWRSDPAATQAQLYRKLEIGRTDLVVDDRKSGLYALQKLGISDVRLLNPPLMETQFYHFLHRKRADLVPRIQATLMEMSRTHEIDRIAQDAMAKMGMPASP